MRMDFHDTHERYKSDPQFKQLVDMMVAMAMNMDMSPGEIRIAASYAEVAFFAMHPVREAFPIFAREIDREYMATAPRNPEPPDPHQE